MHSFFKRRLWIYTAIIIPGLLALAGFKLTATLIPAYLVALAIFEFFYRFNRRPSGPVPEVKTIKFREPSTGKTLEGEIVNQTTYKGQVWFDVRSYGFRWAVPMNPFRDSIYCDNDPAAYEDIFPGKS